MEEDRELISRLIWATCQLAENLYNTNRHREKVHGEETALLCGSWGRNLESLEVRSQVSAGDD